MLSKKLCKKCLSKTDEWKKLDEARWRVYGFVICPIGSESWRLEKHDIRGHTPEHCPYALEHLMKENSRAK